MYNQQDWAPDHVRDLIQERFEKNSAATTSFSLDDAFSDADDSDPNYAFSSIVIRTELARAVSYSQEGKESGDGEESSGVDATGDTSEPLPGPSLDISGTTLDVNHLGAKFDSVSLSESPVEKLSHEGDHSDVQDKPEVTDDGHELRHTRNDSTSETQHPVVSTEDSHSDSAALDTTQESRHPSPAQSELPPDTSTSEDEPETPPGQTLHEKSASTPSLPVPSGTLPSATSSSLPPSSIGHKFTRSVGPSVFEKVVSKTRPSFLPPKSRDEDQKHMADWEKMMKRSRAAEEKRRKALQDRRIARELQVEQSLHIWEKEILPDWKIVHRNPAMRKRWWAGIPTKLRATMWERAVGNSLALSQDSYRICLARAKRALSAGTFPTTSLSLIEQDVRSTLPSLHIFHPDSGPMYAELKDMLYAWVVSRSDEGLGYIHGTAKVAAMILLNMSAGPGFIVMKNLLERHCMRSFYGGFSTKNDMEAYYRIFDTLLADGMPKIYFNFKQHQISPSEYLHDWIVPLFLDHLPFEACARLWDVILLEGDAFLYRASLAILAILESRLFFPDKQELLELLRGENKAALEVARREGRPLNGGKYEIYGVDEETLWDRIEFMNDWWKESTWNRLLQRELPDI
ncbi:rab-GTPase-TBC domain-containing protein [Russula ochroleuca]|uniref:Rab-GTPase-TBC domain-containing protein n=1 Tax=Russula ochroleuca TaxID=152965 RepID=A0A9P5MYS5_9AGAM|nr:rab-GTPase-TBC domain-containing protein [Russula ochroleuca]